MKLTLHAAAAIKTGNYVIREFGGLQCAALVTFVKEIDSWLEIGVQNPLGADLVLLVPSDAFVLTAEARVE